MTPKEVIDLAHGIMVVDPRGIIFYIESFSGMGVVKVQRPLFFIESKDIPGVAGQGNERHGLQKGPSCHHNLKVLSCVFFLNKDARYYFKRL
jgi:hypothetical protein